MTISIDEVVVCYLDMWIQDGSHVAARSLDLRVHLSDTFDREVLWIEAEVFIAISLTVLVSPLDIHDEDINGELVVCEVLIPLHNDFSRCYVVLREMEAEGVKRGKRSETSHSGEGVSDSLVTVERVGLGLSD